MTQSVSHPGLSPVRRPTCSVDSNSMRREPMRRVRGPMRRFPQSWRGRRRTACAAAIIASDSLGCLDDALGVRVFRPADEPGASGVCNMGRPNSWDRHMGVRLPPTNVGTVSRVLNPGTRDDERRRCPTRLRDQSDSAVDAPNVGNVAGKSHPTRHASATPLVPD
jgi:hypothetical protein